MLSCPIGLVSAQDDLAPEVTLEGILISSDGACAIVRATGGDAYLARPGQDLGGYTVLEVSRNRMVLGYGSRKFPIQMEGDGGAALPPGPCLRLRGASLPYAIKLVCQARRQEVQVAPDVSGKVTLHAAFVPDRALEQVLENTAFGATKQRGMVIVARRSSLKAVVDRFEQNLSALSQASTRKVSMDFMLADLRYFCQICAKEMNLSIEGQPPTGQVTCRVSARPAAQTLALACALQTHPVAVSLKGKSLVFRRAP